MATVPRVNRHRDERTDHRDDRHPGPKYGTDDSEQRKDERPGCEPLATADAPRGSSEYGGKHLPPVPDGGPTPLILLRQVTDEGLAVWTKRQVFQ